MHTACDTVRFRARHYQSAAEAIRAAAAGGLAAILLNGRPLVLDRTDANALDDVGVEFSFVGFCRQTGRILQTRRNGG